MRWHYDLTGAEPIVRDVQVYDSSVIENGELLMLGTTDPDSGNDHGVAFITAATGDGTEADNALGISLMKRDTGGPDPKVTGDTVSVATAADAADPPFNKAIINPFAVYLAEYDQGDTMSISSTSGTTLNVTSLEDDIDLGWVYAVTADTAGNANNLRQLTASASGSATMDSALSGGDESGGSMIKILPRNHELTKLASDALGLGTDAAAGSGTELAIVENYVADDGLSFQTLKASSHRGTDLTSNGRFFADIKLLNHIYNKRS